MSTVRSFGRENEELSDGDATEEKPAMYGMMAEVILGILMVVTIAKIADADGESAILWGAVALGVGWACWRFVPYPFARIFLAGMVTYGGMTGYKLWAKR